MQGIILWFANLNESSLPTGDAWSFSLWHIPSLYWITNGNLYWKQEADPTEGNQGKATPFYQTWIRGPRGELLKTNHSGTSNKSIRRKRSTSTRPRSVILSLGITGKERKAIAMKGSSNCVPNVCAAVFRSFILSLTCSID